LETKTKIPFLTDTIKRLALINTLVFLALLILLNVFLISLIYYYINKNVDRRISHELENVLQTIKISKNYVAVIDSSELKEPDFNKMTSNPYFLQVYNFDNKILLRSKSVNKLKYFPIKKNITTDSLFFDSFNIYGTDYRCAYYPYFDSDRQKIAIVQIAVFQKDSEEIINKLIYFNIWIVLFFLLLVIVASIIAAKKTFRPINEIIETAQSINSANISKRIEIDAKPIDEIGRLRDTLNGLFNRIESYIIELRNFSNHLSHQLMNPLTAVLTEVEYLLKHERPTKEYIEALIKISHQNDTMIRLIKTLRVIVKSGKINNEPSVVFNLSKFLQNEVLQLFQDYNIKFLIEENLYVKGNADKFSMVFQNLIYNSIKYSPEGEGIIIKAAKTNDKIIIQVEDKGLGIIDSEKEKVFQKFYRSLDAENNGIKGFGLGLSLVKSIIDEYSGTIKISDNYPKGTIVQITLPFVELKD